MGVVAAFATLWSSWQSVAILAAMLSLSLTSIAYAFSTVFRLKSLQMWAKDEVYQALASAFIAGAIVIILSAISGFSCNLIGSCATGDHLDIAIGIMNKMRDDTTQQVQYMFDLSLRVGMITELGKFYDFTIGGVECLIGLCETAIGFTWYLWAGGSIIMDSLDYSFGLLIPLLSSFIAQAYLLEFIKTALFPSLLAMGIILRTFFFTRKVGGLLIAIALALYTIYPFMYIMLQPYFTWTPRDFYYPSKDFTNAYAGFSCWGTFVPGGDPDHPFCIGTPGVIAYIIPGLPQAVGNYGEVDFMFRNGCRMGHPEDCPGTGNSCGNTTAGQQMCIGTYGTDVYAGMLSPYDGVLPTVGYLMVPGAFLPLLIILITISFIKVLSPQLGGDIEIAGLSKFI